MERKPEMVTFQGDGLTLAGARWPGGDPAVICIHGMAGSSAHWNVIARGMPAGRTVLAMDIRGRGRSDKPARGYDVEHHCRDILAMMDGLGLKRAVLMGHSLGALIALSLAANNPRRTEKLILIDGGGRLTPEQHQKVLAGIAPTLARLGKVFPSIEALLDLMKTAPMLGPWTGDLEEVFRYDAEEVEGGVRSRVAPHAVDQEIRNLARVDVLGLQKRVACPTLILRADQGMVAADDLLLPPEAAGEMMANIRDSRLEEVAGSNHYTIVLQPHGERDRALAGFLGS